MSATAQHAIPLPDHRATPLRIDPTAVSASWLAGWLHDALLGEFEAVGHLSTLGVDVTIWQLRAWRRKEDVGPKWIKAGSAALYCLADLQKWAEGRETRPPLDGVRVLLRENA